MENQEQEKKAPVTEELSREQMEEAAGGGFIERVGCFFTEHGPWLTIERRTYKGSVYEKMRCTKCDKIKYEKNYQECSESEYNAVPFGAEAIQGEMQPRKK
jgi:hypothetical protein